MKELSDPGVTFSRKQVKNNLCQLICLHSFERKHFYYRRFRISRDTANYYKNSLSWVSPSYGDDDYLAVIFLFFLQMLR